MGFKFPPGFHLPRRGGMKKERKDGGREERRLTGRKRAGAPWGLGSFFVWAKGRVFGHLPWNPPPSPSPSQAHLSCRFLCPWRPGVFTHHHQWLPDDPSNSQHLSFLPGGSCFPYTPGLPVQVRVPDPQSKLQGESRLPLPPGLGPTCHIPFCRS